MEECKRYVKAVYAKAYINFVTEGKGTGKTMNHDKFKEAVRDRFGLSSAKEADEMNDL